MPATAHMHARTPSISFRRWCWVVDFLLREVLAQDVDDDDTLDLLWPRVLFDVVDIKLRLAWRRDDWRRHHDRWRLEC